MFACATVINDSGDVCCHVTSLNHQASEWTSEQCDGGVREGVGGVGTVRRGTHHDSNRVLFVLSFAATGTGMPGDAHCCMLGDCAARSARTIPVPDAMNFSSIRQAEGITSAF